MPIESWPTTWSRLRALCQPGFGLPGEFYGDDTVYAAELDKIWRAGWLFAAHTCEIPEPGNYLTFAVGPDPIVVLRGDDGQVRAFHNVCTHRGTLLCQESEGRVGRAIVCPYHQWTFGRDGKLIGCRGMHDGVDKSELGLGAVAVEVVAGMIYVSLSAKPPDFTPARAVLASAAPHAFDRAKVAKAVEYEIPANWKIVWENNRECYHCDANHPQYVKANFDTADAEQDTPESRQAVADAVARWSAAGVAVTHARGGLALFPDVENDVWCSASRTVQVQGYASESMDGRRVAPLMGTFTDPDVGVLRMRSLPNFWNHTSCDHAVTTRLLPGSQRMTRARVIWLVDGNAVEGRDYHLDKLMPFWQLTSEQDWHLCEMVQRGVDSAAYRPGPFSKLWEYNVQAFVEWYLRQMAKERV
jgi:glycine betaine monooxygenase A